MTKKTKFLLQTLLIVALIASLVVSLSLVAFADQPAPETREFNSNFDQRLDVTSANTLVPAYLAASWNAGEANTETASIYKFAADISQSSWAAISYTLRLPQGSTTTLSDLKLGFRNTDDSRVLFENFETLLADSGGSTSALTANWATYTIEILSLDLEYTGGDKLASNNTVGFHLVADGDAGAIDILEVKIDDKVYEDFAGGGQAKWWAQPFEVADIVAPHYALSNSSVTCGADAATFADFDRVVLTVAGSGSLTVAPVNAQGTAGTAVAWNNLVDGAGTTLAAIGQTATAHVVALSSLASSDISAIKITSTGSVQVFGAFLTNMESRSAGTLPVIGDFQTYETFSFEMASAPADYEAGVVACADLDLDYMISYKNGNLVSVTDGNLVFDVSSDYTNFKFYGAKNGNQNDCSYLVMKVKAVGGADLGNFRMAVEQGGNDDKWSPITYANTFVSAFGVPSTMLNDPSYPYVSADGYTYIVIDLAETFGAKGVYGFDMYYTGAGQLLVDEIAFCNTMRPDYVAGDEILTEDKTLETEGGYVYGGHTYTASSEGFKYLLLEISGTLAFDSLRFELLHIGGGSTTVWLKDHDFPLVAENSKIFALELAQFLPQGVEMEAFHTHIGDFGIPGTVTISSIKFANDGVVSASEERLQAETVAKTENGEYNYGGHVETASSEGFDHLLLELSGTAGYNFFRVELIHIGGGSTTVWLKDINMPAISADKQIFALDLTKILASGVAIEAFHMHMGGDGVVGEVTLSSVKFAKLNYTYDEAAAVIPTNDDIKPIVEIKSMPDTAIAGRAIAIAYTASDNLTASGSLTVTIVVTLGTTDIAVDGDKFTPPSAGTYIVTVTVKDSAGNSATASHTVEVSPSGMPGWAIALIVIAAVLIVGAVVAVVVVKKRKA